jgi:phosphoribosylaminoimidazole-succinocarboxamide synthase
MDERPALARDNALPEEIMMQTSATYRRIAERITGEGLSLSDNPKAEIVDILGSEFELVDRR